MQLLESEPSSTPASQPHIPALREQLAILVATGKAKEAFGVLLTHGKRKQLDAQRHYKGFEICLVPKAIETVI